MMKREIAEQFFTFGSELHDDLASIFGVTLSRCKPAICQAVNQLHSAVMLDLKSFGDFADGGRNSLRHAFDGEHKLMLLWLDAGFARRTFAESKETANVISEFRQSLVIVFGNLSASAHVIAPVYRVAMRAHRYYCLSRFGYKLYFSREIEYS